MSTDSERDARERDEFTREGRRLDALNLKAALQSWGEQRRRLKAGRDPLVRDALTAGVSIEEIHRLTWLARTTIDRIGKEGRA